MNSKQKAAFERLQLALMNRSIELAEPVMDGKRALVNVNGAMVLIGVQGGYSLPEVKSYKETGKPGETAFDAACQADVLLAKQQARAAKKIAAVAPAAEPVAEAAAV